MADWLGDYTEDHATVTCMFTTHSSTGAPVAPLTAFEAADVIIYKNGSGTQKTTTNGVTMTSPFDSITGLHCVVIDTSNDTGDAAFWVTGNVYTLVLSPDTETVDGVVVAKVIGQFGIELSGALRPTTASRKLDVSTGGEAGIDWANVGSPTTSLALTGTTIATTQKVDVETIKTNPVVNGGTITFPSGATLASTTNITAGTVTTATNVTTVNGLASGVITATSIAADAITAAKVADGTIDAATFAAGAINAAAIAADAITDAKVAADVTIASVTGAVGSVTGAVGSVTGAVGSVTGNVGGNVTGSVGSVVGAVGSVTGNVGGNVTGSVGSVASGGITAASLASDAITAAKIADGAIDAATFASGALDAVWSTAARTLTAGTNIQLPSNGLANVTAWTVAITGNITGNLSGSVGSVTGLTASNLDATISSRMATYTQPTGFLAASFPSDPADQSLVIAATDALATLIGDVPTNAELSTALGTADDAVLAQVALVKAKTDLIPGTSDGLTFAEKLTLMASVLLGKASGLETTTAIYRAADDSKDRVTATVDEDGNRSSVTLDAA